MQHSESESVQPSQHVFVKIFRDRTKPNEIEGESRVVSAVLSSITIDLTQSPASIVADAFGRHGFSVTTVSEIASENCLYYVLQRKVNEQRCRARSQSK